MCASASRGGPHPCGPSAPPRPASHATAVLGRQVFEILLSRGYSENNFREDLKNLYLKLGIENRMMIFLFTDAHVAEEGFLELINNMLTSGTRAARWALGEAGSPCSLPRVPAGECGACSSPRTRPRLGPARERCSPERDRPRAIPRHLSCDDQKRLRTLPNVSWGAGLPPLRTLL